MFKCIVVVFFVKYLLKFAFNDSISLFVCHFCVFFGYVSPGAEQYRSDCDIKTNGTENLLYKHQNMDSPNSVISRSPLQMRQASPFPHESTNRRYVTAAAPNPQDRHRSSGKFYMLLSLFQCLIVNKNVQVAVYIEMLQQNEYLVGAYPRE